MALINAIYLNMNVVVSNWTLAQMAAVCSSSSRKNAINLKHEHDSAPTRWFGSKLHNCSPTIKDQ